MEKMSETQKAAAARELCRMRGTNPDDVEAFNGHNSGTANTPAWRVVMIEIEAQEMLELAMQYGRGHEA